MMRSLETAATGMAAQQRNLDVIANNLANINTTSFKAQRAEFQDLMYQTYRGSGAETGGGATLPSSLQVGMGSKFVATNTSFRVGTIDATGGQLDVAINGQGFFAVTLADGGVGYTRDGSFKLDSEGALVTGEGFKMATAISIPADAAAVTISRNGTVTATVNNQATVLGTIPVYSFPNQAGLDRVGSNIYKPTVASGDAVENEAGLNGTGELEQGHLEGSNVDMVVEMVKMILAQRAYEVNSKAIMTADEMLSTANNIIR